MYAFVNEFQILKLITKVNKKCGAASRPVESRLAAFQSYYTVDIKVIEKNTENINNYYK